MSIGKEELIQRLTKLAFGNRLISNMYRGLVAETVVASALSNYWHHCSADWNGWDFVHENGCRLEVKQSAVLQSWSNGKQSACQFSIAPTQGYWVGDKKTVSPGRQSAIYVFAHHGVSDLTQADHCEPLQWKFYVVPAFLLPAQKLLSLAAVVRLARSSLDSIASNYPCPCDTTRLGALVDLVCASISG